MLSSHTDISSSGDIYLAVAHPDAHAPIAQANAHRLAELFSPEQLDTAMDQAGRISQAIVAVFAAAPIDGLVENESAAIEFAVEYMVPPCSLDFFHRQLESQLARMSPRYLTGRYRGEFGPCVLRYIPPGAFHQHRVDCGSSAEEQRDGRWSRDRRLVEGIIHQARIGWRDLGE